MTTWDAKELSSLAYIKFDETETEIDFEIGSEDADSIAAGAGTMILFVEVLTVVIWFESWCIPLNEFGR
jgi:hypothetical protein